MDELLKARKMGSAAARRLKTEEREKVAREAEDRRQRKLLYGYSSSEDESSDDDSPTYSPIVDDHADYPTSTATDTEPHKLIKPSKAPYTTTTYILSVQQDKTGESPATKGPNDMAQQKSGAHFLSPPQSPVLTRDPTIVDDDDASMMDFYSDLSGAEDEYNNMPTSPGIACTAQSVHYLAPLSKPSIVSVRQSLQPIRIPGLESRPRSLLPMQLSPPPRSAKRLSAAPSVASSDTPRQVTIGNSLSQQPSQAAVKPLVNRTDTVPAIRHDELQFSTGQNEQERPDRPHLKSSKQPSFTRPSTGHGEEEHPSKAEAAQPLPQSRSSYYYTPRTPSVSAPTRDPSPLPSTRPRDSLSFFKAGTKTRIDSTSNATENTPARIARIGSEPAPAKSDSSVKSVSRKKSFSGLRSRSESIGKAIRSASSGSKGRGRFPIAPPVEDSPPVPELRPEVVRKASEASFVMEDASIFKSNGTGLGLRHMS